MVRFPQLIGLHGTFFAALVASVSQNKPMELFDDEVRSILCADDVCRLLLALTLKAMEGKVDLTHVWNLGGPNSVRCASFSPYFTFLL